MTLKPSATTVPPPLWPATLYASGLLTGAVLPESRLWTSVTVPVLNRPPATRPDAFAVTVLLMSVTVLVFSTPPPRSVAVLLETVLFVSVRRSWLSTPPPAVPAVLAVTVLLISATVLV